MKRDSMIKVENYFEFFLIVSLLILFLYSISIFLVPILFAISLAFIFYRPHKKLSKLVGRDISASILSILVLFLLVFPFFLLANSLINDTSYLIDNSNLVLSKIDLSKCGTEVCLGIDEKIQKLREDLDNGFNIIAEKLISSYDLVFNSISVFILKLVVFIFSFFFLLLEGESLLKYLRRIIPMKNSYKEALFYKFRDVSSAVFIHTIFIAVIQGILVGIGFYFLGVPSPIFWAFVSSFAALLPFFGAGIVWIPVAVYFFVLKDYMSFAILSIYGLLIISLVDNVLRPILIKRKVNVHPFIIFLSIFGSLELFGFVGLFLGPIIISLLVSVLELYKLDFK